MYTYHIYSNKHSLLHQKQSYSYGLNYHTRLTLMYYIKLFLNNIMKIYTILSVLFYVVHWFNTVYVKCIPYQMSIKTIGINEKHIIIEKTSKQTK